MGDHSLSRYAAVDIGSNAVRLLLCNVVKEHGVIHYNKSEFVRVPLRLGEDAFSKGKISDEKKERFMKVMRAFKLLIEVFDPVAYRACATAALREAVNGTELANNVKEDCGLEIEVISGKEEAALIYSNHVEERLEKELGYLYVDVGGGSTEITLFYRGTCVASRSFNIGTLRIIQGGVTKGAWDEMKEWAMKTTASYSIEAMIGSGGNINKINKLIGKRDRPLPYSSLRTFYNQLKELSVEERIDAWGLNPDRADVIVPAAKIFLSLMKATGAEKVIVPEIGLSDGIIHQLFENNACR